MNYYQASLNSPHHLSIGAILFNKEGKIGCHYFEKFSKFTDFYRMMKETMEQGETHEQTLHRGLMEEFGATGEILDYIGVSISNDKWFGEKGPEYERIVEKCTMYFLVELIDMNLEKRSQDDPESSSEIRFIESEELISNMQSKSREYAISEFDESKIINRAVASWKSLKS